MKKNTLLSHISKIFGREDEQGLIISKTIMSACNFNKTDFDIVNQQGLKNVPVIIKEKTQNEEFTDEKFLHNLFSLNEEELSQLPISLYSDIVESQSFNNFGKDKQTAMFGKVFKAIGVEYFMELEQADAERVAYNHAEYKTIFQAFFKLNKNIYKTQADKLLDKIIDKKFQEMLDKAPELTNNPDKLKAMTELPQRHKGNLYEATEEVLSLFEDTKDLKQKNLKKNLNALGVGNDFEHSSTTAKAVLAQYKLGAFAEAAKAKGLITEQQAEKYSIVDQSKKDNSVNKYINTCKNVLANFAKPQNLAKIGFRQIATKAAQHLTEGTIPGIGAAVGLAMKLAEIFKDKQKSAEVFKEAIPDLVRGVVTLGVSFSPLAPIAGPIGTVASIATKGIKAAHQEGLTLGHGFMKRVFSEFIKKGNLLNLAMSGLGAAIGGLARNGNDTEVIEESQQELEIENDEVIQTEADIENEQAQYETEINANKYAALENQHRIDAEEQLKVGTSQTTEEIIEPLSYAEQYIAEHPGAYLDKNGWMVNADGSYARNENGQLFGDENRVFRELNSNEMLDDKGNIIDQVSTGGQSVSTETNDYVATAPVVDEEIVTETTNVSNELNSNVNQETVVGHSANANTQDLSEYNRIAKTLGTHIEKSGADKELIDIWQQQKIAYEVLGNENSTDTAREEALQQLANLKEQKEVFVRKTYLGLGSEQNLQEEVAPIVDTYKNGIDNTQPNDITLNEQIKTETILKPENDYTIEDVETHNISETQVTEEVSDIIEQEKIEQESDVVEQTLPVRSQEELAQIETLQKRAIDAKNFNSLPEKWQKELIDIKAKAIVEQEQGNNEAYENLHKIYEEKFNDFVAQDKELDAFAEKANIRGTAEWRQREADAIMVRTAGAEEKQEMINWFNEKYGSDMGNDENGVRQYIREGGNLKMNVPEVPERNFAELGYKQQTDGTWIMENKFGNKVINDVNRNGIPDAGDTYNKSFNMGGFSSVNAGKYVETQGREIINPNHNANTELEKAIARERAKLNLQDMGIEK